MVMNSSSAFKALGNRHCATAKQQQIPARVVGKSIHFLKSVCKADQWRSAVIEELKLQTRWLDVSFWNAPWHSQLTSPPNIVCTLRRCEIIYAKHWHRALLIASTVCTTVQWMCFVISGCVLYVCSGKVRSKIAVGLFNCTIGALLCFHACDALAVHVVVLFHWETVLTRK